jgi:hypothetical protein
MFGNTHNKSKFHSRRNYEQTEVRECLLSFGSASFMFSLLSTNIKL